MSDYYDWSISSMLEVTLDEPDNFLKIKETLTRIGVASRKDKKLYQSCHILHKQGRYFIVHFLEMFALDGRPSTITDEDIKRRNAIAKLLQDWGLLKILNKDNFLNVAQMATIKILTFSEKNDWKLVPKYSIGTRGKE